MINFRVDTLQNMNGQLKQFIEYLKASEVDDDMIFDCRLVSCELIANVLRHCGCSAMFSGALNGGDVEITVCASTPRGTIAVPALPDVLAEGGRGLYIVSAVSGGNVRIVGGNVTVILKKE